MQIDKMEINKDLLQLFLKGKVDIDTVINQEDVYKELFIQTMDPKYHEKWFKTSLPGSKYLKFAKQHVKLAQEAISYWFKFEIPVDLVIYMLKVMTNCYREPQEFDCSTPCSLYCFIDQSLLYERFQPTKQLICLEQLQMWINNQDPCINLIVHDQRGILLTWMLKSECSGWKRVYLDLWLKHNKSSNLSIQLDHIVLDKSWCVSQQLQMLSLASVVTTNQLFQIISQLDAECLENMDSMSQINVLIAKAIKVDEFQPIQVVQLFATLLETAASLSSAVPELSLILNWISIVAHLGTWQVLNKDHFILLSQCVCLLLQHVKDPLLRMRLYSFPYCSITANITEFHHFYLNSKSSMEFTLLYSTLLAIESTLLTKDERQYVETQLFDLQLRKLKDINDVLASINTQSTWVKIDRKMALLIDHSSVVVQWIYQ